MLALGVAVGDQFLVQHNLTDAGAIAQIEKDQIAVIAAAVHPAHQNNSFSSVSGAKIAAVMRPFEIALKIKHY
jgi:hypothetical protein